MTNSKTFNPENFALKAGLILMVVPSFFWLGVSLAIFFEKPLIVEEIMLPVDRVSSILTLLIMGGLPLIAILVNLKSLFQVEYSPHNENVLVNVHLKKNINQYCTRHKRTANAGNADFDRTRFHHAAYSSLGEIRRRG